VLPDKKANAIALSTATRRMQERKGVTRAPARLSSHVSWLSSHRDVCMPIVPTLFSVLLFSASWDSRSKPATPPSVPTTGLDGLDQYRGSHISVFTDDFGQLARYRDADAALGPPAADENRVVFYGDSITDLWKLEESFPGKRYVNRGIGGETTSQMLVRFRQDVINLQATVVIILARTNDIAGNGVGCVTMTSRETCPQ